MYEGMLPYTAEKRQEGHIDDERYIKMWLMNGWMGASKVELIEVRERAGKTVIDSR